MSGEGGSNSFSNFFNKVEVDDEAISVSNRLSQTHKEAKYPEITSVRVSRSTDYRSLVITVSCIALMLAINFVGIFGGLFSDMVKLLDQTMEIALVGTIASDIILGISLCLSAVALYSGSNLVASRHIRVKIYLKGKKRLNLLLSESEDALKAMSRFNEKLRENTYVRMVVAERVESSRLKDLLEQRMKYESELVGYLKDKLNGKYVDEKLQARIKKLEEQDTLIGGMLKGDDSEGVTAVPTTPKKEMVVSMTRLGYVKCLALSMYHTQRRGGKGVIGQGIKKDDTLEEVFIASSSDYLLFFTGRGEVHRIKVSQLPEGGRYAHGKPASSLLRLRKDERIASALQVSDFSGNGYITMITRDGLIKKTNIREFEHLKSSGIRAITLEDDDELVSVLLSSGNDDYLISTKNGMAIRFNSSDVTAHGREAMGVSAIQLDDDKVAGAVITDSESSLLTVTSRGYGKRTAFKEYPLQKRGGKGVIDIKTGDRNGSLVAIKTVWPEDEILSVTSDGKIIRTHVSEIPEIGRNTQGVKIMDLQEGGSVVSVARIVGKKRAEDLFKKYKIKPPGEDLLNELLKDVNKPDAGLLKQ